MEEKFNIDEIKNFIQCSEVDSTKKEIGDRVQVLDYSGVSHKNGLPLDFGDADDLDGFTIFVVIDTSKKIKFKTIFGDFMQDILMVDTKTNMQYWAVSKHLKIF